MQNNKDLEQLFDNIKIVLSKGKVKELNEAIISFISMKEDINQEIDYVIKIVCNDYQTNIEKLKQKNVRGVFYDAKHIIYCILHLNLGLSIRHIAKYIFFNDPMSVYSGIKRYKKADMNLKQDKMFVERYNRLSEKLIEYFKNKNNWYENKCI